MLWKNESHDILDLGEFMSIAIHNFNATILMASENPNENYIKNCLEERVNFLLSILPKGTKYLGAEQYNITSLSIPYMLKFEHPIFDGIKSGHIGFIDPVETIELDYARIAWLEQNPEKVEQDKLFLGIRYLTSKGENRFPL